MVQLIHKKMELISRKKPMLMELDEEHTVTLIHQVKNVLSHTLLERMGKFGMRLCALYVKHVTSRVTFK